MASVFDRRRLVVPERCPPPLRRKRGFCNGWLGFEWWRLKLSNEQYRRESLEQYEKLEKAGITSREKFDDSEEDDMLRDAEQQCHEESLFFDPTSDDGDEIDLETGDDDQKETLREDTTTDLAKTSKEDAAYRNQDTDLTHYFDANLYYVL